MASKGLTISAACRQLGISEKQLRAMMADGRLRYRQVNRGPGKSGHIVIDERDVAAAPGRSKKPVMTFGGVLSRNTRLQAVARAVVRADAREEKRTEFLRSWTGQDHLPPAPSAPSGENAPVVFKGVCSKATADR